MSSFHSRKRFLALGAGAAAAAAASPAAAQIIPNQFGRQLTIGVVVPMTGPLAAQGNQIINGVRGAIDEANRMIGQLDRSFGMRTFDDENAIATGIMSAQFAGDDPTIVATVGHLSGVVTNAALQQYANAKMPLLVPATSADQITAHGYRNVFRLPTKDSTEGALFAHYVAGKARPKKAVALTQDGDYGYDVARAFAAQAAAEKIPAELLVFSESHPAYDAVAKKIAGLGADYVYLAGNTAALGPIIPALKAAGYAGKFGASQGFYNAQTLATYGAALGDALVSTSMPPLERVPAAFDYLANLRARYGEVTPLSAFGFAAAQLAINVVKRSGAIDRMSLNRELATGGSYDTIVGTFSFSLAGDPNDPNLYFYSAAGSKFKYAGAAHSSSFLI